MRAASFAVPTSFARRWAGLCAVALGLVAGGAQACNAVSQAPLWGPLAEPTTQLTALPTGGLESDEVRLSYIAHSTFLIETAAGVTVATDYAGFSGPVRAPTVVTMNNAHETHFTNTPNPAIEHVLRGWGDADGPAEHDLFVEDLWVRNVTTDVSGWGGARRPDGNSVFLFQAADLCIAHFGHLHYPLTDAQLGQIGFIDIALVPVDGVFTMAHEGMAATLQRLRAQIVIPMHYWSLSTLTQFAGALGEVWPVTTGENSMVFSRRMLPDGGAFLIMPSYRPDPSAFD